MRTFVSIALLLLVTTFAKAQKFGYIETEVIVEKMPDYKEVKQELEKFATNWEKQLKKMKGAVDQMKDAYKVDEVLLTPEMKKLRLDSITIKENELISLQERIFGYEGSLFRKRQDLMKPIQEKVYEAVEKVCRKKKIQFMFDKSADLVMIYASKTHNYTDFVLEELGLGDPKDTPSDKE
ncbi:MAG: OmpH family outer membrane protein [Flammeovirgaceae bacterium]